MPEHAQARAWYDHPFFGRWPAITENHYGSGTLLYEGTYLSDTLQEHVLLDVLKEAALTGPDQQLPAAVRVRHGVNRLGKRLHYYFNYSSELKSFAYSYAVGKDLLTGGPFTPSQSITLKPWDVAIVEED
jgi:beta-galactosidase